jgi:transglutaminase-like putative cysteine protease
MRFSAIHKATSYLMIAAAFATLALSRELSPLVVTLTLVLAALSFFFEPARHTWLRARAWTATWNAITLVAFAWSLLDVIRGDALTAGVRFLCLLLVNKLWNRRGSRDYLQAYVVSFLMLVAGAALNNDLAYAGCFLAYVIFATWTLTLFHLRREMEENYLIKHSDDGAERVEVERILNSRRIVGWSFLGATSLVSIGVFISAGLVFFLIPRFGFGLFATHSRRSLMTVGFSDRVDLDRYGLVKDNPQVVMRVEFPHELPGEPLHFRGVTFDKYDHGRWSRTNTLPSPIRRWGELHIVGPAAETRLNGPRVKALFAHVLEQQIYVDPLDTAVLFAAAAPVAYKMPEGSAGQPPPIDLEARSGGEVYAMERRFDHGKLVAVERKSGLRYSAYSDVNGPDPELMAKSPDADVQEDPDLEPYLAVPADLPPRIAELARSLTAGATGPYAKTRAIIDYLSRYKYTLDLKRNEKYEPLEDFLFVERAGHCEYFASALAIMLRTVGVPTRSVNGFYGGEWNPYGKYIAIRQGDAHSWVEVWLDGLGWTTFDPTPPGAALPSSASRWNKLRQLLDNMELAWFKYVIEYDLGKQAEIVGSVRRWAALAAKRDALDAALRRHGAGVAGAGAIGLGAWLLLRALRRRTRRAGVPRRGAEALHAFERAVRALERRGFARRGGETGRELAARVKSAADPAGRPFGELVELYYAARFGRIPVAYADLERLAQAVLHAPPPIAAETTTASAANAPL